MKGQFTTLDGVLRERCAATPDACAFREYDRRTEAWREYTWRETAACAAFWRARLADFALAPGERVAIMAPNGVQWVAFDHAALSLGLVTVPLFARDSAENAAWILRHSGARALAVADRAHHERLASAVGDLRVVHLDEAPADAGEHAPAPPNNVGGDDLATIVYTSGTTGKPKGVMLTHTNILENARACTQAVELGPGDRYVSFLPLSHMFERTAGCYLMTLQGVETVYVRGPATVVEDIRQFRPTIMLTVPRVLEQVVQGLHQNLASRSPLLRGLFKLGLALNARRLRRGKVCDKSLLARVFGAPLSARLGGRLRIIISGGAALSPGTATTLNALGLPARQGYGLTETSPVVSLGSSLGSVVGSIGKPLRGVEARIGKDDELCVRGSLVTRGYWRNEETTAAAIDKDGWLHTGDCARIDDEGRLFITGRIKELIVLGNGELVSPTPVEAALCDDPHVAQALLCGEGRACTVALVVPDRDYPGNAAADKPGALEKNLHRIALRACAGFPPYMRPRRVVVADEAWTVDNGLLTATLKPKRAQIIEKHARELDAAFADLKA